MTRESENVEDAQKSSTQSPSQQSSNSPKLVNSSKPDFSRFRLSQDFAALSGVEQIQRTILVGRPKKTQFVRTRTGSENQLVTSVLEHGDQREIYLVEPHLCSSRELISVVIPTVLRIAVTLEGVEFIWPLRLPDPERPNRWHVAAFEGAKVAEERWLRRVANMPVGTYDVFAAKDDLGAPRFSELLLDDLLEHAFKDRIISSPEHPVLRALRGEVG